MKHIAKARGLLLTLTILFAGASAYGQKVSGNISGLVTDPSGSAIQGAQITVLNVGTGVSLKVSTTSTGYYFAPDLIPGRYTVTAQAPGFKQYEKTDIVLDVDSVVRVDCPLVVGAVTQTITVKATALVLKTDKSDVSDVLSGLVLTQLPVLSRDVSQLIVTEPGALRGGAAFIGENPGADSNGFVNGRGSGNNYHEFDGIDNEETIQGVAELNPPIDSLQEMKITTNAYDAQYGQVSGAVFEASTKSGTNKLHGSAFEYVQNNDMFARDPFTQSTINVAPWRWNEFGGSIGGPIKKDKLFFFGDYQGMRSRQGSTLEYSLPTAAMRQGNFSEVASLYPIFDPTTGNANGQGRVQFQSGGTLNVIPAASLDPVAAKLVALLPMPNTALSSLDYVNNFIKSGSFTSDTDEADPRIDYDLNSNTRMFGRYSFLRSIYDAPPIFGNVLGGAGFGPQAEVGGTRTQNLSFTITHNFGATLLGDFRYGLSRFRSNLAQTDIGLKTAQQFGIPGINFGDPRTDGLPEFAFGGPIVNNFFFGNPYSNFYELEKTAQYSTNWTKIRGSHTIKWGADLRPKGSLARVDKSLRGVFSFGQLITGTSALSQSGIGFASFLVGASNSFTRGAYLRIPQEYQDRDAFYGEDLWRVNKKLTLTLGLRWEYDSPTYSYGQGGEADFDPTTADVVVANMGVINKFAGVKPYHKDYGPRLGIAYSITPATVLRMGYGRSFAINTGGANYATLCCLYPLAGNQAVSSPTNYTTLPFTLEQGPPSANTFNVPIPPSGQLPLANGQAWYYRPFDDKVTSYDSFNATLERQFSPSLTASIAYVGGRGRHVWVSDQQNSPVPGAGAFCARQKFCSQYGLTQDIEARGDMANSNFNSMQIEITKKFTSGYQVKAAYTWQRTVNSGTTNPFNLDMYHSVGGVPQWLTLSNVVTLPFGPGQRFASQTKGVPAALIGGWTLSGITQFQAGDRLSPSMNQNTLNVEYYSQIPNCTGNPNISNPTKNAWFNDSVFQVPPAYTFGNCGLSIIKGPRWWNSDLMLGRNFRVTERVRIAFEWMWTNAFNTAELTNPNTTIDNSAAVVGHITDVHHTMRRTQLGLHLYF